MSIKSNNTDIVEVKYGDNNINSIYIGVFLLYIAILINLTLTTNIKDSSFSRASTGTLKDFEGIIKTAKTNEVRFEGVRRVENLLRYSEDFSNNEWKVNGATKEGIVSGIGPNGEDAYEIGMTADTNIFYQTVGLANNKTYSSRILVRAKTGTCNIRIRVSTDGLSSDIELNETWKWISSNSFPTIGTGNWHIVGGSTNINNFYILKVQTEDITGQANQNPSEYVSTDSLNQTVGSELVTNGTFDTDTDWTKGDGWSIENGKANQAGGHNYSSVTQYGILTVGKKVIVSYTVTNTTSGGVRPKLGGQYLGDYYGNGEYKYIGTTTQNENLSFVCNSDFDGSIDNVSVKEIKFEANVDGVKYFDYENGNTVSNNIVIEGQGPVIQKADLQGILIEPQATGVGYYSTQFDIDNNYYSLSIGSNSTVSPCSTRRIPWAIAPQLISITSVGTSWNCYKRIENLPGTAGVQKAVFRICIYNIDLPSLMIHINDSTTWNRVWLVENKTNLQPNTWYDWTFIGTKDINSSTNIANIHFGQNEGSYVVSQPVGSFELHYVGAELGSAATSLIETGDTTVTRIADNLSNTNDKFPNKDICIVMTVTPVVDFADLDPTYIRFFGTYDNRDNINRLRTFGSTEYGLTYTSGLVFLIKQSDFVKDVETKVAFSLKQNGSDIDAAIYKDGVKVYSTTVANMTLDHSNLNKMTIGNYYGNTLVSNFKDVKVFKKRTDAQLISLTTI